ncbi:MAG: inositol monophosphatase family protein [Candidatus Sumerlaeaceae bacterium]
MSANTHFENATIDLSLKLAETIRPGIGTMASSSIVGEANSGDYTFAIDAVAEAALGRFVDEVAKSAGLRLAYYSEDRGLVEVHSNPEYVFVVDPIDGTRPAICGLESCCVSAALAPLNGNSACLSDVVAACLVEIKSGVIISAAAGAGVCVRSSSRSKAVPVNGSCLSRKTDIEKMFWATEMCGRPSQATQAVLGELINASSFAAACFVFNSASYAISRVVLGQLDAYADVFAALLRRANAARWESLSKSLFHGKVFGLFPYDIAAAAFIAEEAGAFVTDAQGNSLGNLELLDSSSNAITSAVIAANKELGQHILGYLERGFRRADGLTFT